jgi:aquacobalamin reductase/NAD(P)H-flavin reductase
MKQIQCQVHSLTPLTDAVYQVLLKPLQTAEFLPGQYLNFVMSEDDKRPFSIASAPHQPLIELQIGAFVSDSYPMQVIERIKESELVTVEVGGGKAQLREDSERPLLLLAGGTGFSYIKSILEHLVATKSQRTVLVYWGLREPSACFQLEETQALVNQLEHGSFVVVVETAKDGWQGRTGRVHEALMTDVVSLEPYDIYLAGPFAMIGALRQEFIEKKGALVEHMYADAFEFI